MIEKKCGRCGEIKPISEFSRNKAKPDGLCHYCKPCKSKSAKEYREKYPDRVKAALLKWRSENTDKELEAQRRYRKENKEKTYRACRRWKENNKDYYNAHRKNRLNSDPQYKLSERLRIRLYHAIRDKQKVGSAVRDLGCSIDELKEQLESMFEPGMSWDNHGEWHIDHIIPLAAFDLTDREQFEFAAHHTNLQPLWATDNLSKGDRLVWEQE